MKRVGASVFNKAIGYSIEENNSTGFNALPSGYCNAVYMNQGVATNFWTSDYEVPEDWMSITDYYYVNLSIGSSTPYFGKYVYRVGMSVSLNNS
jgi:hypothetical protein